LTDDNGTAEGTQTLDPAAQQGGPQGDDKGTDTGPVDWEQRARQAEADRDKWKNLSRSHEGKAKSNADAAAKLAQLEDSQKSEQQRLTDRLTATEVELAQYRTREVRTAAAVQAGLSPDMAEYLTEVEPEKALAQAKKLAERLKPAEPKPADLRQGARGAAATPAQDPNAWLRAATGRA
jgi:hypothetical protein